jgi:hypothetical protein
MYNTDGSFYEVALFFGAAPWHSVRCPQQAIGLQSKWVATREETESVTPNGKMSARSALTVGNTFLVTNVLDLTEGRSRNQCQSGRS